MLQGESWAVSMGKNEDYHGGTEEKVRPDDQTDVYFSADVETDGPIPGRFSILSFALVYAGRFDGTTLRRPNSYSDHFYCEVQPISSQFQQEALDVNGLDRDRICRDGLPPSHAMSAAFDWIASRSGRRQPVLVAYPLSFDWSWLFWYFTAFCEKGSPFNYSRCFDIKTALSVKTRSPISASGRSRLPKSLLPRHEHTHHALDDAIEQAEIFANVFEWKGEDD